MIFSINHVTKCFERGNHGNTTLRVVIVEESLVASHVYDHFLQLCAMYSVPLVRGPLSMYLTGVLGRKQLGIVGVVDPGLELPDLSVPVLPPALVTGTLPPMTLRMLDATPSEAARKKKAMRAEKKKLKKKT